MCAAIGTPEHDELPDHGQAIADAAVKEAVEKGVSYFDCAPVRSPHPTPLTESAPLSVRVSRDSPADSGALSGQGYWGGVGPLAEQDLPGPSQLPITSF